MTESNFYHEPLDKPKPIETRIAKLEQEVTQTKVIENLFLMEDEKFDEHLFEIATLLRSFGEAEGENRDYIRTSIKTEIARMLKG
ncbi:MAG: hypothetical protein ACM3KR_01125 [Deltaproteobacteria bacterium]